MTDILGGYGQALATVALMALLTGCARQTAPEPPAPENTKISGTVTYRERLALPQDAVVEVVLQDVSRADARAPSIARTALSPAGREIPLPFELRYDPAMIVPSHRYAVRATIRNADGLLFTSTTTAPVLTGGHGQTVDLVLSRVQPSPTSSGTESLVGSVWIVEDIEQRGVIDFARATLEFPEAGRVVGRGSCNRFFGGVTLTDAAIAIGPLGTTRMACAEAVMNQEARYLDALRRARRFTVDGTFLRLYGPADAPLLRLVRDTSRGRESLEHGSSTKGRSMHARGSFEVTLAPQAADTADSTGIGRMTIDKRFHGDLEATSRGQMLAFMTSVKGSAGYVAVERVTGTLGGRSGSFALQHNGIMDRSKPSLVVQVIPDSGTDALTGLTGRMTIVVEGGVHSYTFDYTLPAAD